MKKEIAIIIIILIGVVIGNVITQNYTKKCIEEITAKLESYKEKIIGGEEEKLQGEIEKIKSSWNNMQEKLAFYIEHDELEKVETQLFMIEGNTVSGLYKEIVAELDKCTFILEHIGDKTTLNVKNIF